MIPFSPPYISESTLSEVVDSLKSGWITTGPKVKFWKRRRLQVEAPMYYVSTPGPLRL